MKLKYKVVSKNGNKIKGYINVDDINDLEIILINFGFKKIYIKEYKASRFRFIKNKMSDKQILIFIKKLIGFLKINASLSQALSLILESSNNKIIQRFIFNILINLNLGSNIVESIKASTLDNRIKINIVVLEMLEILDASGDMIGVLESILNYLSSKLDLENKFKLSTIYPKIVLTIGLVVFTVFMVFIVPSYKEMFVGMGIDVPNITLLLFNLSDILVNNFLLFVLVFIILIVFAMFFIKTRAYQYLQYLLACRFELFKTTNTVKFCSTMHILLNNQISLVKAISYLKKAMNNYYYNIKLDLLIKNLKEGMNLSTAITSINFLSTDFKNLISISEKQGLLLDGFRDIELLYKDDLSNSIKKITVLIEPILILLVAVLVILIMMMIFIPMLQIIDGATIGGL